MVFIVKIPNRSRATTPEANAPAAETPPTGATLDTQPHPVMPSTASANVATSSTQAALASTDSGMEIKTPPLFDSSKLAAELDVLVAPAVLHHKYVRGVDKSLIVERPERIRAVLLGIATAIGKTAHGHHPPPVPSNPSRVSPSKPSSHPAQKAQQSSQPSLSAAAHPHAHATTDSSVPAEFSASSAQPHVPSISTSSFGDDDLVARLSSLSVEFQPRQKFRVLRSNRSLALDPPHPAVAFTHAHSDELVDVLESAYDRAKQRRRQARADERGISAPHSQHLGPGHVKSERETTPTPASAMPSHQSMEPASTPSKPTSHAQYLEYLCGRAPNRPPSPHNKPQHTSPSKSTPDDSDAYTSSDGEGDQAMHASEVPEHLPQGDLYLAGPSEQGSIDGGSAQAIRHAMGACCEAVDRVAAASSAPPSKVETLPLTEIEYDNTQPASFDTLASPPEATSQRVAPPARRAFVLCRPPGHHCSGSTPQGFCWVNNAIVAAAHAYLTHAIDRVVIFDIDLHHGNGTQNLAWRINADANKHDDARAERLASLRAAALERARVALGTGSGRAHASRLAKVALTEQDEAEAKKQAGPRALRLFYSSLHDIESFPCEDGDANMIKDASCCVEGAHGQWIWNVHLDHYRSEADFKRLYDEKYKILFSKAQRFLTATSASPGNTLVLISAGFDACAYEYPGMQRHGKHVPPSFYHTFARDAVHFADSFAQGKLVSVLEGGYSDRALCSAALAHVTGLATGLNAASKSAEEEAEFWKLDNLIAVEKVAKKMSAHAAQAAAASAGAASTNTTPKRRQAELAPWLSLTSRAFAAFETACGKPNIVALGATLPARSSRPSATTSTVTTPTNRGRVLRHRSSRRTFEDSSTPQTNAAGRRAASPAKRETPTKARVGGASNAPFDSKTPVKAAEDAGSMPMEMDTPMRSTAAILASMATQPARVNAEGSHLPHGQPTAQAESSKAQPAQPGWRQLGVVGSGSWVPPSTTTMPASTDSDPPSPALTAEPITLVDAMSTKHQVVDANTRHVMSASRDQTDLLGLDYLRQRAYRVANGGGDGQQDLDEDAEGSPDLEVLDLGASRADAYFPATQPQRPDTHDLSGALAAFSSMSLENATLSKSR